MQQIDPAPAEMGAHGNERQSAAVSGGALFRAPAVHSHLRQMERKTDPAAQFYAARAKPISRRRDDSYLDDTIAFWQPFAARQLSREDAREMAHNLVGFFMVLREWTLKERERARCGIAATPSPPAPRKRGRPRKNAAAKDKMQS